MKKIALTFPLRDEGMELLRGKAEVFVANERDPNNFADRIQDCAGLVIRNGFVNAAAIEKLPNLDFVATMSVGFDHIDVDAATKKGILVLASFGANARSVAEHTMGLLLALNRKIVSGHFETLEGTGWRERNPDLSFELAGKTMGIIGLGNIGKTVAKLAKAFGMKVIGYDPFLSREDTEKAGIVFCDGYDDVLKNADVVTVHVPRMPETINLIGKRELGLMKKSALILNTARGKIINEEALTEALNSGTIAGAAIDVFAVEPVPVDAPILKAKNLVCTPHIAAMTREAIWNMTKMCVTGCLAVLNGEKWPAVANPEVYELPKWKNRFACAGGAK
ncbi:MAG: hydroxyacid dehydrogenase, partial [Fusobacteriaceae bacterium]|jgi:D-3-phosphoglycerate dehydrogenase|nr:hydroxyacid dehydrogenase [Fusobacteriaceae bacterium]